MKKNITLFLIFVFTNCYSQDDIAKNIIYLDIGFVAVPGAVALGAGINYERMLNDNLSIRAGINIGIFGTGGSGDAISGSGIGFPVTINYLTNNKNKFEAGLGAGPHLDLGRKGGIKFLPAIKLGYRYQPDENGMMYKAGFEFPANMYISIAGLGYHFK